MTTNLLGVSTMTDQAMHEAKKNGVPQTGPRPRMVLIVEDDRAIREALVDGLDGEGFTIKAAEDGAQALDMIKDEPPDLILLDLMMPRMTGWQVMEEMQKEQRLHDIPIVVVTAARYAGTVPSGSPVFIKPLRLERLIQSVRAFLG
jgi:CheY-like chemotaxis protein